MDRREFLAGAGVGAGVAGSALWFPGCERAAKGQSALEKFAKPIKMDPAAFAEVAVKHFIPGKKTCGESILLAACETFGVETDLVPNIALGLAGGVGLQGKTCGLVTGSAMVLGLVAGAKESEYEPRFKRVQKAVGIFVKGFEGEFDTTVCREICGLDLTTPEGMRELKTKVKAEKCSKIVRTTARMLAESLATA